MPCAAPCDRLPCDRRCSKPLACGHRCPGICSEACAEGYCRQCSNVLEARVDFLEMKSYRDIDVDENPVVVLGCGHFFTAESLDGILSMTDVYQTDMYGRFTGLKDLPGVLAQLRPACPDCKCPVRQFSTRRYNRAINRAVIDEISRRFLTTGKSKLHDLGQEVSQLERRLRTTRDEIMRPIREARAHVTSKLTQAKVSQLRDLLSGRYEESQKLETVIGAFCKSVSDKCQPARKLHEATVHATRRTATVSAHTDVLMASLTVADTSPAPMHDRQITRGGRLLQLKTRSLVLDDHFLIAQALRTIADEKIKIPGEGPIPRTLSLFRDGEAFIDECKLENLPKMAVEVSLLYADTARAHELFCRSSSVDLATAEVHTNKAQQLLQDARAICHQPFQNAESLRSAVEELIRVMKKQWYEEVTEEEIESIKAAMVSGPSGIATHSGHWYNCENGHPVSRDPTNRFDLC